ncbi:MAG: ATP-binding protein [Bacteroidota bacterium]
MIKKYICLAILLLVLFYTGCNQRNNPPGPGSTKDKASVTLHDSVSARDTTSLNRKIKSYISSANYLQAAYSLNILKEIYIKQYDYARGISVSKQILRYKDLIRDRELIAGTYNTIGLNYWRLGILDSAVYFLKKSVAEKKLIGDSLSLAKTYNNLGAVYWKLGDYGNYYRYTLSALNIRERLNDIKGVVLGLNNIGMIYQRLKYYDMAKENSLRALALSDSIKFKEGQEYSRKRLGSLYLELNDLKTAEKYINQAATLLQARGDKSAVPMVYCDLGRIRELKKDYSGARGYFDKSYQISLGIKDKFLQSFSLMNIAHIDIIQNRYPDALEKLNKARILALEGRYTLILKDINMHLSSVYMAIGDKEKALLYLNEHLVLKDSLLNTMLVNSIGEMRIRYMIEASKERQLLLQKEVEAKSSVNIFLLITISILLVSFSAIFYFYTKQRKLGRLLERNNAEIASVNDILKRKNSELTEANNTKHKLFSIIAHDLKNPFTSILGYAYLIKETSVKIGNEELISFTDNLLSSSQRLVSLIANLTGWAQLQKNEISVNPRKFDICRLTEEIVKEVSLNAELKQIDVKNELNESAEVYADHEMISTVIRNILSNAIKFTPKDGNICVSGCANDRFYDIVIRDSGVGMTDEKIRNILAGDKMSSDTGTENEMGTGLGLSISRDFLLSNKGVLNIRSEIDKGSEFIISIPFSAN